MDWYCSGRYDTFRYVQVDKSTMQEVRDLDMFLGGGSIEYNDLTSLKVSGSLPYTSSPDIGYDYLRIYSTSRLDGDTEEVLHGTFILSTPSSDIKGETQAGTAQIYPLLQVVADAATDDYITIDEGTNIIAYAVSTLQSLGLSVVADKSDAVLSTPANFKVGVKWLEIINDLCTMAGFSSADVDAAGNIRLYPYTDPATRAPSIDLVDGQGCIYTPTIKYELDIFDVPNVVITTMSNQDGTMRAVAKNTDPLSIYSNVSRGREVVYTESVSDIDSQEALQALADRRLAEKTSAVESIEVSHSFIPYQPGEVGRLIYRQAGFEFTGAAVKKQIKLVPGMPCSARFRRFVRG